MMHDHGKSDSPVVPAKLPNNAGKPVAEAVEERGLAKGNTASKTRPGHSAGTGAPSALDRVRRVAQQDREAQFTALLHHVDVDRLRAAYRTLRPGAAAGVDGVTWQSYGQQLEANLHDLHARLHRGAYRAKPSRRAYIPKADGRLRSLGVASLEDKIVQRAVVEVLGAIYGKRRTTGMEEGNERVLRRRSSESRRPRVMRWRSVRAQRSVDRGARRPAIEPRNAFDWGADALVDVGRQHRWRRFREPSADPAGSENPFACVRSLHAENREVSRSPACGDGRAGRAGKAKAVIP
ncbi:MAG: hypothetical protein LC808_27260 [Actinobacteria bacterium]|nr:hypothetical protein [Actinomycetota bacterium]